MYCRPSSKARFVVSTPGPRHLHTGRDERPEERQAVPSHQLTLAHHGGLQTLVDVRHSEELLEIEVTDLRLPDDGGQEGELL